MELKRITVLICIVSGIHFHVQAQVQVDSIKNLELPQIVIVDHELSDHVNINTANNKVSAEQLNLIRPERVTDGLTFLPGVYNVPDGIGGFTLNVRGVEQNRVNIYFNGIPLRSNTEGRINLDGLSLAHSDLSVEKGAASLIYGANSSGNVVRINSRIISENTFGSRLSASWGNNGKQQYNVLLHGNSQKKLFYQASINMFNRNSFRLPQAFDTIPAQPTLNRTNSDQKNSEVLGILTYMPNTSNHVSLAFVHSSSKFGYPPSTSNPRFRRMDFWRNTMVGVRHTSSFNKRISMETNVFFTILKDTLNEYNDKTFTTIRRYSYWNDKSIGAKAIFTYRLADEHKINLSPEFKKDIHEQKWFTAATTKAGLLLSALEYSGRFLDNISVTAGSAFNFTNPIYTSSNDNIARRNLSEWNYQCSVGYNPISSKYRVHAGFSRTSIFPRMRDMFGDVIIGYTPNPNLKSETSNNLDIGAQFLMFENTFRLQLGGYHSAIENLITQIRDTDTTNQVVNLQSASFFGIESMIQYSRDDKIHCIASYSMLTARNTSANRTSDNIAYRPEHQLKAIVTYNPLNAIGIDLSLTYQSVRKYDNMGIWNDLPAYVTMDMGISFTAIKYTTIWFKFNNLLDEYYVSAFDQPSPGREYRIGVAFDFKKS